ncbi:unnamed protein product [Mytilus edulis]|uniref:DUF3504 domain-containing protein n=1 Tax=Mytilus edulis TaxID=6550 RepID=A0A8S3UXI6_MYTED|nr:unnamed protein product [Mytilus edulis]
MKSNYCAIPELLQFTANDVNQWLSKFVIETRRKDGKPYPPKTLYLLCVGILRFHRENGVHMNFLDEKDCVFYDFRRSLSARMTELTKQGIGTTTKQAEAISEETESTLWEKGLLGSTSSKAIMNTMFFYNSKLFGLRGVDEHRNLSVDQFELGKDQTGSFILFKGRANKTYKGGLNQRNLSAKNLKHYLQNPVLFKIYEQYLNIVRDLNGTAFYRRPLDKGSIKFGEQSVGVNQSSNIMKTMCAEAGIDGYFTNHSGKRTCATTLYQAGVPEQEIMNRTGHRSVESVRKYKRASSEMLKDISIILEPSESMCRKLNMKTTQKIKKYQKVPQEALEVCSLDVCSILIVEVKYICDYFSI